MHLYYKYTYNNYVYYEVYITYIACILVRTKLSYILSGAFDRVKNLIGAE